MAGCRSALNNTTCSNIACVRAHTRDLYQDKARLAGSRPNWATCCFMVFKTSAKIVDLCASSTRSGGGSGGSSAGAGSGSTL
eukprot:3454609-Pleurochrysis_carterae.AAC.1